MLGWIITVAITALLAVAADALLRPKTPHLDPAERLGLAGLLALGLTGTLVTAIGLVPDALPAAAIAIPLAGAAFGAYKLAKGHHQLLRFVLPTGNTRLFPVALAFLALFPLVAALAPSTAMDWDSLAYHLAVPKLWLTAGEVHYISTIHHSNFPFALDALFITGLITGGESSAKSYMWAVLILGMVVLYGHARRHTADSAKAWWAPVLLAGSPVVLWESGTAYIDVGHGLYIGLGVLYTAEMTARLAQQNPNPKPDLKNLPLLAGLCFGLGLGSKLTGLQTFAVAGLLFLAWNLLSPKLPKVHKSQALVAAGATLALALAVSALWFAKSTAYTGNPVFPFFFETFGGRGWDQWRADIYRDEQQTFGVGRTESGRDPLMIGHAVFGLATQPGRFVNPGQTIGAGFPTGAIGFATLAVLFLWAVSGRARTRESFVLAWVALSLLLWFFLSQQSRYLTFLVVPAAALLPSAIGRLKLAPALLACATLQAAYSAWLLYSTQFIDQMRVVTGVVSAADYRRATTPFAEAAEAINKLQNVRTVALYDEVFGFLLDQDYFWANPGHGDRIDDVALKSGADLAAELRAEDVSHVYLSFAFTPPDQRDKFLGHAGLAPTPGYTPEEQERMRADRNLKWRLLLAEAVRDRHLIPAPTPLRRGILFELP